MRELSQALQNLQRLGQEPTPLKERGMHVGLVPITT